MIKKKCIKDATFARSDTSNIYKNDNIMKKTVSIFMLFALALVSTTVWAESLSERIRASKNNVTKEVNVGGFDAVCLNGSSKIIYTQT